MPMNCPQMHGLGPASSSRNHRSINEHPDHGVAGTVHLNAVDIPVVPPVENRRFSVKLSHGQHRYVDDTVAANPASERRRRI
jgi:hypothetical protein